MCTQDHFWLFFFFTVTLTTLNNTRWCFYQSKTVDSFWHVNVLNTARKDWQCTTFKCTRYTLASISKFWLILTLAVTGGLMNEFWTCIHYYKMAICKIFNIILCVCSIFKTRWWHFLHLKEFFIICEFFCFIFLCIYVFFWEVRLFPMWYSKDYFMIISERAWK